ncbi:MAG: PfkB family carbohydrate kinase [Chloroflexi bacterium]|nr:PfkB family carbohydrate kinase [Chloroflexota bacterium]
MTLLVAGWVALDEIETPFAKVEQSLGGSATCAALAAAQFTDVRLLAAIGEDFPERERSKLEGRGIDLAGLRTVPGGTTSRWGARYHYDMNTRDTLYTHLGVNDGWQPVLPEGWEDSSAAFMAADDPATQRALMGALTAPRATMVDTIKLYIEAEEAGVREAMREASFASVNETEARQLTGVASIAKAARSLVEGGARAALVKLGEYGAVYASEDDYFVAPGYPLEEVVDPTGAGDSFAGAFLGYLDTVPEVTAAEIRRGIIYGSTVASFAVEGFGPNRLLELKRDEVEARYREFRTLTHIEEER